MSRSSTSEALTSSHLSKKSYRAPNLYSSSRDASLPFGNAGPSSSSGFSNVSGSINPIILIILKNGPGSNYPTASGRSMREATNGPGRPPSIPSPDGCPESGARLRNLAYGINSSAFMQLTMSSPALANLMSEALLSQVVRTRRIDWILLVHTATSPR